MLYFAYGSNMHPQRLKLRVPSSKPLGTARLSGYQLSFQKRGRDGSGKCTIMPAKPSDAVLGVVYRILPEEKILLDEIEGVGFGYTVETVAVSRLDNAEILSCFAYQASPDYRDESLLAFDWYHDLVVRGACLQQLPQDYIAHLQRYPTTVDNDLERRTIYQYILDSYSR